MEKKANDKQVDGSGGITHTHSGLLINQNVKKISYKIPCDQFCVSNVYSQNETCRAWVKHNMWTT